MADMTHKYNTQLNAEEEVGFKSWLAEQSKLTNKKIANDLYNYDLRGLWKSNNAFDFRSGHAIDTFKKPNHPTFSEESMYHNTDGYKGGQWEKNDDKWRFIATETNIRMAGGKGNMLKYFENVEPGNEIIFKEEKSKLYKKMD